MKNSQYISWTLLIVSGIFLLCTVFATDQSLEDGFIMGKIHWFHTAMLFMSVCSLVAALLTKSNKGFTLSSTDGLVLLFATIVALTYNQQLNPAPEKILFGAQLVILWFLLKFIFSGWTQLRFFFLVGIIVTALVEAILGMRQLYGFDKSNHSLFKLTGDFYNPGPFSGYLALALPICLWMILQFGDYKKAEWKQTKKYLYYLVWATLLAIILVLPAGMSRTSWLAAIISCGWIYWEQRIGWKKTKQIINEHRTLSIISSFFILILAIGALVGIYALKKDSANGRLLLWKVTGQAIMEQPWTGTGIGGFPTTYTDAQAAYFASGKASEVEKMVAGCPDYAFNEFLQIGLEQGIVGLMVFVLLLGYSIFRGVKNEQTGAVGGIIALIILSLASYPLQLPEFWIVLVVLMGITNTAITSIREGNKILFVATLGILTVISVGIFCQQNAFYQRYKKWHVLKQLNNNKIYEAASKGYEELAPLMLHRPEFLFETALCLNRTKRYTEANILLYRAIKLSCDPMIHYVTARNEQSLGNYQKAEKLLLHAIDMLPERIYPYYLLTKLYTEPDFFHKDKFIKAANAVLTKEPKVNSKAIGEMRTEVKKMLRL